MGIVLATALVAMFLWGIGIVAWTNAFYARYMRLQNAFRRALKAGDTGSAVILGQAMREMREDFRGWANGFNPIHWLRTLTRDYTARAAWDLYD